MLSQIEEAGPEQAEPTPDEILAKFTEAEVAIVEACDMLLRTSPAFHTRHKLPTTAEEMEKLRSETFVGGVAIAALDTIRECRDATIDLLHATPPTGFGVLGLFSALVETESPRPSNEDIAKAENRRNN